MKNKEFAKKYLITSLSMLTVFFIITLGLVIGIVKTGTASIFLSNAQIFALSFFCAYFPVGAYCGFCICLIPIQKLTKAIKILFVFLFPLTLCGIIFIGNIMLIPSIIKAIVIVFKSG